LDAEFGWSKDPTPFSERLNLDYKPIKEGEPWGQKWESAWFHLTSPVPEEWSGKNVIAELDFSGEGLVFDSSGKALQGITNGSIWDPNFARTRVPLIKNCEGGEPIDLWVEAAANSLFGVFTDVDPSEENPKRHGWFNAKVEKMRIGLFDEELWHLYLDARILLGLAKRLDEKAVHRVRIIRALNNAVNAFGDDQKKTIEARECLKSELRKSASASDLKVSAIGHAHIDTGWLWPVRETVRKCARTFATQLDLIEKYPDYIFGASQPQHYQFMKDNYPEIYSRIKEAVKKGQWELQGGMWVEADCNLISGESMIRQILHGKNFFKEEFGING
jgi:alpha-mannosidase